MLRFTKLAQCGFHDFRSSFVRQPGCLWCHVLLLLLVFESCWNCPVILCLSRSWWLDKSHFKCLVRDESITIWKRAGCKEMLETLERRKKRKGVTILKLGLCFLSRDRKQTFVKLNNHFGHWQITHHEMRNTCIITNCTLMHLTPTTHRFFKFGDLFAMDDVSVHRLKVSKNNQWYFWETKTELLWRLNSWSGDSEITGTFVRQEAVVFVLASKVAPWMCLPKNTTD